MASYSASSARFSSASALSSLSADAATPIDTVTSSDCAKPGTINAEAHIERRNRSAARHAISPVVRGMTHDGLGKYLSGMIEKAPGPTADIVRLLKETKTDVVVNFLPVGSEMATKGYVEQASEAG